MKKLTGFLIVLLFIIIAPILMSVNSQSSAGRYEYATVDTDPAAAGYWTNEINPRGKSQNQVYFSLRGSGSMTVTLQFICTGDASWTDYDTYTAVTRLKIEGAAAGVRWRAGVKDTDYTSGSLTFGFDW